MANVYSLFLLFFNALGRLYEAQYCATVKDENKVKHLKEIMHHAAEIKNIIKNGR